MRRVPVGARPNLLSKKFQEDCLEARPGMYSRTQRRHRGGTHSRFDWKWGVLSENLCK